MKVLDEYLVHVSKKDHGGPFCLREQGIRGTMEGKIGHIG